MRWRRRWAQVVPLMMLWLLASVFFWSWVFTFLTDAEPAHKLVLFAEMKVTAQDDLALALEEGAGREIRMVKVHPFSYAMLDGDQLRNADLFIVTAAGMETYGDWFRPLPEDLAQGRELYLSEGAPLGVRVWNAETGRGTAADWLSYPEGVDCYLCIGVKSLHAAGNDGALDDDAAEAARRMLSWPDVQAKQGGKQR